MICNIILQYFASLASFNKILNKLQKVPQYKIFFMLEPLYLI